LKAFCKKLVLSTSKNKKKFTLVFKFFEF